MVIFKMRGCDILKEVKFAPLQVIPLKWLLYIFLFSSSCPRSVLTMY